MVVPWVVHNDLTLTESQQPPPATCTMLIFLMYTLYILHPSTEFPFTSSSSHRHRTDFLSSLFSH